MNADLIDQIYECAFVPENLPSVLRRLAKDCEGVGGVLCVTTENGLLWTASRSMQEGMKVLAESDLVTRGQRWNRLREARHAGFVREVDMYSQQDLEADPFYSEFYWPRGLGWAAGTMLTLPTGEMLVLSVERAFQRGPVEPDYVRQLDALRPHLARTALISARLQLERARTITHTLAMLDMPALVVDDRAVVLAANPLIEALKHHIRWRAADRVSLADPKADAQFRAAVTRLNTEAATSVRSFVVRGNDAGASLVAHLLPIRGNARDVFNRSAGVLVLTNIAAPKAPPVELVQSLFDLTPSEARVARSLAIGNSIDDMAADGGISRNTVRTHMRGVLEKTGCRRQAEVVALFRGIAVPAA